MPRKLPDIGVLRRLFCYESDTGVLYWRPRPVDLCQDEIAQRKFNARYAGKAAGAADHEGYLLVGVFGRTFRLHRVAFAVHHGRWPEGHVDHINHDKRDNRACNLREVTHGENMRNLARRERQPGVYWMVKRQRWRALISVDGQAAELGTFKDYADALSARKAAEAQHGYHPNHGVDVTTLREEAQREAA